VSNSTIDYLKAYTAMVVHGLDYWAVPGLRELRTEIERVPVDREQRQSVSQLDRYLIDAIIDLDDDEVPDDLLQDNPAYPLTHWWWHLGKLRAGTYPAHLLPMHLRAIYQPVEQRLAA
jgi:hypothetical protein